MTTRLKIKHIALLAFFAFLQGGSICCADEHLPPPNGLFRRIDQFDVRADVAADVLVIASEIDGNSAEQAAFDETNVAVAANAFASVSGALASAVTGATASNNTPFGGNNFIPTVDTSLSLLGLADLSSGLEARLLMHSHSPDSRNAYATGTFELELEAGQTEAMFNGSLYLTANGITTKSGKIDDAALDMELRTSISLQGIGTYSIRAEYSDITELWSISGNLPGGLTIDKTAGGVNEFYNFSLPVSDGIQVGFSSWIKGSATGEAEPPTPSRLEYNYGLSSSAWGVVTPLGVEPPDGDFDGDGDVDDDDFTIFAGNAPIDMGATQNEGDADQDGDVDGDDLQIWLDNTETPGIPGDFNSDGDVDGGDFLAWQRGYNTMSGAAVDDGDADRDMDVDGTDLSVWENNFGISVDNIGSPQTATVVVPEPSSCLLAVLLGLSMILRQRTRNTSWQ